MLASFSWGHVTNLQSLPWGPVIRTWNLKVAFCFQTLLVLLLDLWNISKKKQSFVTTISFLNPSGGSEGVKITHTHTHQLTSGALPPVTRQQSQWQTCRLSAGQTWTSAAPVNTPWSPTETLSASASQLLNKFVSASPVGPIYPLLFQVFKWEILQSAGVGAGCSFKCVGIGWAATVSSLPTGKKYLWYRC